MNYLGGEVAFYLVSYASVSATMLVANKWALVEFPFHHIVMVAQFFVSAVFVLVLKALGIISPPDEANRVDKDKIYKFLVPQVWFYASVMTNLAAMKYLSVDLMILIRTCCPFLVAFLDYVLLGRSLPSLKSWYSLITLAFITGVVFVREPLADLTGLTWGIIYYICICASMVYTKKFIVDVKLTVHDRVFWNNALCLPPGILIATLAGDVNEMVHFNLGSHTVLAVLCSCVLGIAMAYTGWAFRARVSSLTFTLVGVLCKIGSITINAFVLDHLEFQSMMLIGLGILASMFYTEPKARIGQVDVNSKSEKNIQEDLEKAKFEDTNAKESKTGYNMTPCLMGLIWVAILIIIFWDRLHH